MMRKTVPVMAHKTMDKLVLDDDTKALVLAVKDLLKDLRARGLNDDMIDALVKRDGPGRIAWTGTESSPCRITVT